MQVLNASNYILNVCDEMRNEAQWDHDRTGCSENLAGGVNMTMTILMLLTAAFFIINLAGPL